MQIQGAEFVSVEDGAKRYPIGRERLYRLVREGEIPSIKLGRRLLVRVERIAEWLAAQESAGREVVQ